MTKKNISTSNLVFKNIFSQNLIMLPLIKLSMVILVSFFVSCDRSGFTNKNKVKLSDEMQDMLNALLDGDYIVEAEPFFNQKIITNLLGSTFMLIQFHPVLILKIVGIQIKNIKVS